MSKEQVKPSKEREINYGIIVAPPWKPKEKGDKLEGTVMSLEFKNITTRGKTKIVPEMMVENSEGLMQSFLIGHYATQEVFSHDCIEVGGFISILYDGENENLESQGKKIKLFKIYCENAHGQQVFPLTNDQRNEIMKQQRHEYDEQRQMDKTTKNLVVN